ncbi:MAG: hypothetical protein ACW98X_25550, partial [Promethearchaeota archaeon]
MLKRKSLAIIFIGFLLFNIAVSFISNPNDLSYDNQQTINKPKPAVDLVGAENIVITKAARRAQIEPVGIISINDELTIKNLNNNPISSILIGIPLIHSNFLVFFESKGENENTILTERLDMVIDEFEMLGIYFVSPILPQQSITINFEHVYKDLILYLFFQGNQILTHNGFVFPILPYKIEGTIESYYFVPESAEGVDGGWGFYSPGLFAVQYFFDDIKAEIGTNFITPFLENLNDKKEIEIAF